MVHHYRLEVEGAVVVEVSDVGKGAGPPETGLGGTAFLGSPRARGLIGAVDVVVGKGRAIEGHVVVSVGTLVLMVETKGVTEFVNIGGDGTGKIELHREIAVFAPSDGGFDNGQPGSGVRWEVEYSHQQAGAPSVF